MGFSRRNSSINDTPKSSSVELELGENNQNDFCQEKGNKQIN